MLSTLFTQRLARLEVVAFISELRRELETDLDADDGLVSSFLARLALALLISLLPAVVPFSTTPWTVDFLEGRGPSDWRLLLVTVAMLRRCSFSCFIETEAALWSYGGLFTQATEPCEPLTFVACSSSHNSDLEVAVMSAEDVAETSSVFPFCLCDVFSDALGHCFSQSPFSSSFVVEEQLTDVTTKCSCGRLVAGGGASYETMI